MIIDGHRVDSPAFGDCYTVPNAAAAPLETAREVTRGLTNPLWRDNIRQHEEPSQESLAGESRLGSDFERYLILERWGATVLRGTRDRYFIEIDVLSRHGLAEDGEPPMLARRFCLANIPC